MLSDLTQEEFEYMKAALEYAQALGIAPAPGKISYRELAEWFSTNPADIKIHELASVEKLRSNPLFRDFTFFT